MKSKSGVSFLLRCTVIVAVLFATAQLCAFLTGQTSVWQTVAVVPVGYALACEAYRADERLAHMRRRKKPVLRVVSKGENPLHAA